MTVLTANIRDIAGADDRTIFSFETPSVRASVSGGVVTARQSRYLAAGGVLTTDDLEPGPAILRMSSGPPTDYRITIPNSATPVQLWPLIDAATPPDSPEWATGFVRNAGGVARVQAMTESEYTALQSAGLDDPDTVYFTIPG